MSRVWGLHGSTENTKTTRSTERQRVLVSNSWFWGTGKVHGSHETWIMRGIVCGVCVCVKRGERPLQGCWSRRAKTSENRAKLTHGDLQKDHRPVAETMWPKRDARSHKTQFGRRRGCQDNALGLRGADGRTHTSATDRTRTPGVDKEQSHRSSSHTCCSCTRLFGALRASSWYSNVVVDLFQFLPLSVLDPV